MLTYVYTWHTMILQHKKVSFEMSKIKDKISQVIFHLLFKGIPGETSIVDYIDTWESSMQTPFKESLIIIASVLEYAGSISDAVDICRSLLPVRHSQPVLTLRQQIEILCDEPMLAGRSNFLDAKIDPSLRAIFWSE